MKIKALEFYKDGYMKEGFALGGSMDQAFIDANKMYPASLQNFLIDTGKEVILVDTGLPIETKDPEDTPDQLLYTGAKVNNFVDALSELGYKVEDIDKVLVTHKHADHTGELRLFKNAKIYISQIEADAMKLSGDNIVRVNFKDGEYKNFESSEKIAEGIYMVPAYGHTKGHSIIIVEANNIYYMLHGDVTYTDEALRQNHISIIFEDRDLAIDTLNKVREFIKNNDTIYLSTHTPEGVESLRKNKIMKL